MPLSSLPLPSPKGDTKAKFKYIPCQQWRLWAVLPWYPISGRKGRPLALFRLVNHQFLCVVLIPVFKTYKVYPGGNI